MKEQEKAEQDLRITNERTREVISKDDYRKRKRKFFFPLKDFDIEVGPPELSMTLEMMVRSGLDQKVDLKKMIKNKGEGVSSESIIDLLADDPLAMLRATKYMDMYNGCAVTKNPVIHPDPEEDGVKDSSKWYWSDLDVEDQNRLKDLAYGRVPGTEAILGAFFQGDKSNSNIDSPES